MIRKRKAQPYKNIFYNRKITSSLRLKNNYMGLNMIYYMIQKQNHWRCLVVSMDCQEALFLSDREKKKKYIYIYIHTYIYMYTHTHTHTPHTRRKLQLTS